VVLPLHDAAGMLPVDRTVCETPILATALEQPRAVRKAGALMFHVATHWYGALLFVPLLVGLVAEPRTIKVFAESKVDVAKLTVKKYAFEAYPQWLREHPSQECPRSLHAVDGYMDHADQHDPWGRPYVFTCGGGKLYVMSLGEDGRSNTADDIWSNE
jgi:hypothetical protein